MESHPYDLYAGVPILTLTVLLLSLDIYAVYAYAYVYRIMQTVV